MIDPRSVWCSATIEPSTSRQTIISTDRRLERTRSGAILPRS
jgi:hypothetical protein